MLKTDTTRQTPTDAVIESLSDAFAVPRTELPPLYDTLDPEALDRFVAESTAGSELGFEYDGATVTVSVRETGFTVDVVSQ